ncbi:MAG: hypothetical protein ABXS93_08365, partial [Sulfurimonas sp.]
WHYIILVAHSQGNLFVNRAYNEFGKVSDINKDAWMKAYIHAIGVASPANNILGEASPYMTFDNDVIQVVPDSLATNVTNPTRYFFRNALDEDVETLLSVRAHSFLTSYMATDITRNSILDFINTQIDDHKNAPSQWQTDQEISKDTKDYRITVKHRFDPNITEMDGVEVFPFAPSQKLYYVDGNIAGYVKASCGGTQIFDSWTDQQSGEVYLINNPQEETIIAQLVPKEFNFYYGFVSDPYIDYLRFTSTPAEERKKFWSFSGSKKQLYFRSYDQLGHLIESMIEEEIYPNKFTLYTSAIYDTMAELFLLKRADENLGINTILVGSIQLVITVEVIGNISYLNFSVHTPPYAASLYIEPDLYTNIVTFLDQRYEQSYIIGRKKVF